MSKVQAMKSEVRLMDEAVAAMVQLERARQDAKWGEQNHPDVHVHHRHESSRAKYRYELAVQDGDLHWSHILDEEVKEAYDAPSDDDRIEELTQVAAVAQAWIAAIQRRRNK